MCSKRGPMPAIRTPQGGPMAQYCLPKTKGKRPAIAKQGLQGRDRIGGRSWPLHQLEARLGGQEPALAALGKASHRAAQTSSGALGCRGSLIRRRLL
jgi:hypothetical protein